MTGSVVWRTGNQDSELAVWTELYTTLVHVDDKPIAEYG